MIAVFGLPAVAVYLFKNGETMAYDTMFEQSDHVSPDTRMAIFFLLLIAYEVMGLHMLTENIGNPLKTLLDTLFFISFLLLTLYNLVPAKNRFIDSPLLPVLHLIICAFIQYIDDSGDNLYLSLIAGMVQSTILRYLRQRYMNRCNRCLSCWKHSKDHDVSFVRNESNCQVSLR